MEGFLTRLLDRLAPFVAKVLAALLRRSRQTAENDHAAVEAEAKAEAVPAKSTQETVDDLNKGRF